MASLTLPDSWSGRVWMSRVRRWVLMLGVLGLSLQGVACGESEDVTSGPSPQQIMMVIPALQTTSDAEALRYKLRRLPGVKKVVMDLPNAEALINFDSSLTDESGLVAVVKAAGYATEIVDIEGPEIDGP